MYFYAVHTESNQGNFNFAAQKHQQELNRYIETPGANGKPRDVHKMSTVQVVNNMTIHTTTILCCDEDEDEE